MGLAMRKFDYVHTAFDQWGVTEEEKVFVLKQDIQRFIGKCLEWNDTPQIRHFLADHEEWDHDKYSDVVEAEFKRMKELTK